MSYDALTVKTKNDAVIADLEITRSYREPTWREIDRHIVPGMSRFEMSDQDQGMYDTSHILDSTADQAFLTAENGMIANVTNPAQRWINLKPGGDPDLAEYGPVSHWFDDTAKIMLDAIEDSGTYETFQNLYGYGLKFSNGLLWMEEDYKRVLNTRVIPLGQWCIAKDAFGEVNVVWRKFRMTVGNLVPTFGRRTAKGSYDWSNFSIQVRDAWDRGRYQQSVDVGHLVTPNEDFNPRYASAKEKAFKSCYFELGGTGGTSSGNLITSSMRDEGVYLREGGYDQIPAFVFQWHTTGDDVYGMRCPGLTALPDIREQQHWKLKKTSALDKMVDPPTYGPAWTKFLRIGHLPGQHTATKDEDLQRGGIRKLYDIDPRVLEVMDHMESMKNNIEKAFYVDVFRMMDSYGVGQRQMTATEVAARQEEKLVQLVGMLNRLNRNVLNPFTDRLFNYLLKQGRLPRIPEELEGQSIKVEYVSMMAQAMRAINMGSINRVLETCIQLAGAEGSAAKIWNKVDMYQAIDEVAKAAGAPARLIRGDEQVAQIEQAQAEARAMEAQAAQMQAMTKSVKELSQSPTDGKSALTDLVRGLGGQAA